MPSQFVYKQPFHLLLILNTVNCCLFTTTHTSYRKILWKKVVLQLQHSQFSVPKIKKTKLIDSRVQFQIWQTSLRKVGC